MRVSSRQAVRACAPHGRLGGDVMKLLYVTYTPSDARAPFAGVHEGLRGALGVHVVDFRPMCLTARNSLRHPKSPVMSRTGPSIGLYNSSAKRLEFHQFQSPIPVPIDWNSTNSSPRSPPDLGPSENRLEFHQFQSPLLQFQCQSTGIPPIPVPAPHPISAPLRIDWNSSRIPVEFQSNSSPIPVPEDVR